MAEALKAYNEGNARGARSICEDVLRRDANDLEALNILGVLDVKEGYLASAASRFYKVVYISGGNPFCFQNIARLFYLKKDYNSSAVALLKAIASDQGATANLYLELAIALERGGSPSEANLFRTIGNKKRARGNENTNAGGSAHVNMSPLRPNGIRRAEDTSLGFVLDNDFDFPADDDARQVVPVLRESIRGCLKELDSVLHNVIARPQIQTELAVLRKIESAANFKGTHYFVMSTGRCGTHAIQEFLERSSVVNPVHETKFVVDSNRNNEILYALMHKLFRPDYLTLVVRDLIQQMTFDITAAVQDGRSCIVTSHGHTIYAPFIRHILPRSKFVFLHRDPVNVFFSYYTKTSYAGQLEPLRVDVDNFYSAFTYEAARWHRLVKIAWYVHVTHAFCAAFGDDPLLSDRFLDVESDKLFHRQDAEFQRLKFFLGAGDLTSETFAEAYATKVNEKTRRQTSFLSVADKERVSVKVWDLFAALESTGLPLR